MRSPAQRRKSLEKARRDSIEKERRNSNERQRRKSYEVDPKSNLPLSQSRREAAVRSLVEPGRSYAPQASARFLPPPMLSNAAMRMASQPAERVTELQKHESMVNMGLTPAQIAAARAQEMKLRKTVVITVLVLLLVFTVCCTLMVVFKPGADAHDPCAGIAPGNCTAEYPA